MSPSPRLAHRLCLGIALAGLAATGAACPLLPDATLQGDAGPGGSGTTVSTSSSSTSSPSMSSSSSSGAGGAPVDACLDASDEGVLSSLSLGSFFGAVEGCAIANVVYVPPGVKEPATRDCIQAATRVDGGPGLSNGCTSCFDGYASCAIASCALQCEPLGNAACTPCLHTSCTPAFNACSGLTGP